MCIYTYSHAIAQAPLSRVHEFTILAGHSLVVIAVYLVCLIHGRVEKEIMHFHYMT